MKIVKLLSELFQGYAVLETLEAENPSSLKMTKTE
jgi:hypothetical protein